jgi:ssDNA-binding Zn-finger/Zn-ribbon topoisomerase 1
MANMILRTADPSVFTLVGENWVPSFIKCRDEIHCRFARKYAYERAKMRGIKAYTGLVYNCERCGWSSGYLTRISSTLGSAMGIIATT